MGREERVAKVREGLKKLGYSNRKVSVRGDWSKMWVTIKSVEAIKDIKKIEEIAQRAEVIFRDETTSEILAGGNYFVETKVDYSLENEIIDSIGKKINNTETPFNIAGLEIFYIDDKVAIRSEYSNFTETYRFANTETTIFRYCLTYCPQLIEEILSSNPTEPTDDKKDEEIDIKENNIVEEKIEKALNESITYDLAYQAHRNTSFTPEERAKQTQESFKQNILNMYAWLAGRVDDEAKGADLIDEFIEKYTKLYQDWLHAKSNCFSVMITGGANFNNRRHEKANEREAKKLDALLEYEERFKERVKKLTAPAPKSTEEQLREAEELHEIYKKLNALQRKRNKLTFEEIVEEATAITEDKKILLDFAHNIGSQSKFFTNNSLAKVKRLREKIEREQARAGKKSKEQHYDGFTVVENYEADRYQIFFDEKPDADTRQILKSLGFRWSGKNGAWQVFLTSNGKRKVESFINKTGGTK